MFFVRPNAESILVGIGISHQTDVITLQGGNRFLALKNIEGTFGIHQRRGAFECSVLDLSDTNTFGCHGDSGLKGVDTRISMNGFGFIGHRHVIH